MCRPAPLIRLAVLAFLLVSLSPGRLLAGGTGSKDLRFGPAPRWVTPTATETPPEPTEDDTKRGYAYRLWETQTNVATEEELVRRIFTISSPEGVQEMSQVRASWDPTYQTLTFHTLKVTRNGKSEERARPERFQTLHREENLQRHAIDGRLSGVAVLDGIQVGDTVEYSYTIRGRNPVFAGRFAQELYAAFSFPVGAIEHRILYPINRKLRIRAHLADALTFRTANLGASREDRWSGRNVKAVAPEKNLPSWFEPYGYVEVSEYSDWAEVAEWGCKVFQAEQALGDELEQKLREIRASHEGDEVKIGRVVLLVQDEVRYLAIAMGERSHRPAAPAEVFRRRFGDCKDKSLLLASLLFRLGYDAAPALVNSDGGKLIPEKLPSPFAFDHAIVRLRFGGKTYWIDGTRSHQGSGLETRCTPDLGCALVLAKAESDLTPIERHAGDGERASVDEKIGSPGFDVPAVLTKIWTYEGQAAEDVRNYAATAERAQISRQSLERVRRYYPTAEEMQAPEFLDDRKENRMVVKEQYRCPDFWPLNDEKVRIAEFNPSLLLTRISRFSPSPRQGPVALRHPLVLRHRIEATLPEPWPKAAKKRAIAGPGFSFESEVEVKENKLTLEYRWKTLSDQIEASDALEYSRKIGAVRDALGYTLTLDTKPAEAQAAPRATTTGLAGIVWPNVLLMLTVVAATVIALWLLVRLEPPPDVASRAMAVGDQKLLGIGGWLSFLGFGVCVIPLTLLPLWTEFGPIVFSLETWEALAIPTSKQYQPNFAWFAYVELVFRSIDSVLCLLLPILFFRRHFRFPILMIFGWVLRLGFSILLVASQEQIEFITEPERLKNIGGMIRLLVAVALWTPYLIRSRRVHATFIKGWRSAVEERRPKLSGPPPLPTTPNAGLSAALASDVPPA